MTLEPLWHELEQTSAGPTQMVVRRLEGQYPCAIHAGLEWPGRLRTVSFEVSTGAVPPKIALPIARGFGAEIQRIAAGPGGRVRLVVRLTERHLVDIFSAFARDLVEHIGRVQSEGEAVTVVASRLNRWRRFFDDAGAELTPESQRGLFGELWLLRDYFLSWAGARAAVEGWGGPLGTPQDFQFASTAIEVKTTTAQQHQHLMIAGDRQLDATGLQRLYLAHLSLDARKEGEGLSLPSLVQQLRAQLTIDPICHAQFDDRLLSAGYLDIHAEQYEWTRYTYRVHHFFEVRDDFPRIVEGDLRPGVGGVKYTIAVAACAPFAATDACVCDYIREHLHG